MNAFPKISVSGRDGAFKSDTTVDFCPVGIKLCRVDRYENIAHSAQTQWWPATEEKNLLSYIHQSYKLSLDCPKCAM